MVYFTFNSIHIIYTYLMYAAFVFFCLAFFHDGKYISIIFRVIIFRANLFRLMRVCVCAVPSTRKRTHTHTHPSPPTVSYK